MSLMQLDIQTMLLMNCIIGGLLAGALFITLLDRYVCPGSSFWFGAVIFSTVGLLFLLIRSFIPLWLSSAFGNGFLVLAYIYLWLGFRRYTKTFTRQDYRLILIAPLTSLILILLIDNNEPLPLRSQVASLVMAGLAYMSIPLALKNRKPSETGRLLYALFLGVTVLGLIVRTITVQRLAGNNGFLETNASSVYLMLLTCFSLLTTGFSIMLIISQWLQQRLFINATYDALTGIYNRYALTEMSDTLELTADLLSQSWSLAMIDIDHFKNVNDQYGHPVGDRVLRWVAERLKQTVRSKDILARYGGEEFVVILPGTSLKQALTWAERARHTVANESFVMEHQQINITVSIGIAETTKTAHTLDEVIKLADVALYDAKHQGRNRVCIHP